MLKLWTGGPQTYKRYSIYGCWIGCQIHTYMIHLLLTGHWHRDKLGVLEMLIDRYTTDISFDVRSDIVTPPLLEATENVFIATYSCLNNRRKENWYTLSIAQIYGFNLMSKVHYVCTFGELRPLQRNWAHFEQFSDEAPDWVDVATILSPRITPRSWCKQRDVRHWNSHRKTCFHI